MADVLKPIRRVVTGTDERGRSIVVQDGPAPNTHAPTSERNGYTDIWVWDETPMPLADREDPGNRPYTFPGPAGGGHVRVVQSRGRPDDYDPAVDPRFNPPHEPKLMSSDRSWDRGGRNLFSSDMHKTETIDYAFLLEGERVLVLDDSEVSVRPGDVVVQVGAWHQWKSPRQRGLMMFDMFAAHFVDRPHGLAQGHVPVMTSRVLPAGVKPVRRIVTIDREPGRSCVVTDGPSPDVRVDPARPGYSSTRLWATEKAPAPIVAETLHLPHTLEPAPGSTVCRVDTFPPDDAWQGKVGWKEVSEFYKAMGSPAASSYASSAPHPYMQKTRTLDFCVVLEGEIVLVLDTQEVALKAGDLVIQRGTRHAWSNRSNHPARVGFASHGTAVES